MLRRMLVIALGALIVSACSSSRSASVKAEVRGLTAEVRDSLRVEQVLVAVHDTIREVTTITYVLRQAQEPDEPEDTVKVTTITERDRVRDRTGFKVQDSRVTIKRDTVYVERRDSVMVQGSGFKVNGEKARASPVVQTLKWVFWIIIGLIGLVIVMKIRSL